MARIFTDEFGGGIGAGGGGFERELELELTGAVLNGCLDSLRVGWAWRRRKRWGRLRSVAALPGLIMITVRRRSRRRS
jgi:hypothetical protein